MVRALKQKKRTEYEKRAMIGQKPSLAYAGDGFVGFMREVKLYARGLSDTEIGALSGASPVFQPLVRVGGTLTLTWSAIPGRSYQVEYSTNLNQNNWKNLSGTIIATNSTATTSDALGGGGQRLYRAVLLP